jgi:glycosyltransferase involved in cell wall biosynthesis
MKLTILLVVLNNKEFIGQAIENFLTQACSDAELLIMDGASTDGTLSIIQEYTTQFPSIRLVSEKDSGQSDAMNKGLKKARGEFVSFLNVDDFYSEGVLNEVVSLLNNDSSIDFITGNCHVWDANGNLIYVNKPSKLEKHQVLSGHHFPVNPTAYFYRKSLHEVLGYYNEQNHYNMDLEFIVRVALYSQLTYVDRDWGNFRMLPNTKTFTDQATDSLEGRKRELLKKFLEKESLFIQLQVHLYNFKRKYYPRLNYKFRVLKDKINYELSKLTGNKN